jgi:hypothetical protein
VLNLVIIHSIWVINLVPEGVSVKACSFINRKDVSHQRTAICLGLVSVRSVLCWSWIR